MNAEVRDEDKSRIKHESSTPSGTERTKARKVYLPAVDILETNDALLLVSEMPGVDESGVDVTIDKNILTISGTVREGGAPEGYTLSYEEYGIGDYERSFTLPNEVDRDGVDAVIKNGVLKLTLPKVKPVAARKVTVKAG